MERIRLSKDEKKVLRMVACGLGVCPSEYPSHTFNASVRSLDKKGLVKGAYEEGGNVADARMTQYGRQYIAENPDLRNPVNWNLISAVAAVIAAIAGVLALFVACSRIWD